jgi:hypothetical protein
MGDALVGLAGLVLFMMGSPVVLSWIVGFHRVPDWVWRFVVPGARPTDPTDRATGIFYGIVATAGAVGLALVPVHEGYRMGPVSWVIVLAEVGIAIIWLALLVRWR